MARRRGLEWWTTVIQDWRESGQAAAEVARRYRVSAGSLYRWRNRLGQAPAFVELRAEPPTPSTSTPELVVDWGGAARLRIPAGLDSEQLSAVLRAVGRT